MPRKFPPFDTTILTGSQERFYQTDDLADTSPATRIPAAPRSHNLSSDNHCPIGDQAAGYAVLGMVGSDGPVPKRKVSRPNWLMSAFLQRGMLTLPNEVLKLDCIVLVSHSLTRVVLAFLAIVGAALLLDAAWLEPSSIRLDRYEISVAAPQLKGLKIAIISDLHAGAPYIDDRKISDIVSLTNAAKPDLVLLTGDYIINDMLGGRRMPIEAIAKHLKLLRAPLGIHAVLGNHEHYEGAARHITNVLQASRISVLENSHVAIATAKGPFYLVGIGDFHTQSSQPRQALAGLAAAGPAICFTHSPDVFPLLPAKCALTVAGHTHGGQVWLPLLGRPAVGFGISRYGQRYAIGLVQEDDKLLFISSGIGTSGLALRFGVPPEVSLLMLK